MQGVLASAHGVHVLAAHRLVVRLLGCRRGMSGGDELKSYQARQGLQFVSEKPRFIQDLLQRTGMANTTPRPERTRPDGDLDDEMPVMVDSDGNVLSDYPVGPSPAAARTGTAPAVDLDEEDFYEEALREFSHEAIEESEKVQQPTSKRPRPSLAVRGQPKAVSNTRLLSFTLEDEAE